MDKKSKIMVVEDDFFIAKEIESKLNHFGYEVCALIPSGEEAIQKSIENKPDLVLIDIKLQGEVDGIDVAREIYQTHDTPVIFLIPIASGEILEQAKRNAPYGYLTKPFNDQELHATIEMALYKSQAEKSLKEESERFQVITGYLGTWELWIGNDNHVRYSSPLCKKLTGYTCEEFQSNPSLFFSLITDDDSIQELKKLLATDSCSGVSLELNVSIITKKHDKRRLHITGYIVDDPTIANSGIRLNCRDITNDQEQG